MYSFKDKLYNENIFQLKDYPHIFKIEVTNYNLIAKIIKTILPPRCFHSLISRLPIIGIPNLQL